MSKKSKRARAAKLAPAPQAPAAGSWMVTWEPSFWLAVCGASGALWFLAGPGFDAWPLAWLAAVPLFFAAERASTGKRAFLFGWFTGLCANLGGFYWIVSLITRFGGMHWSIGVLLLLLLAAYQALVFALFAWFTRRIRQRTSLPMALVAPVVMVTFELAVPFIFPWYLAVTQWRLPLVLQVADLAGPLGVTALILMVNGAVYDLATARRKRVRAAVASAVVLALALGYGALRLHQVRARAAAAPKLVIGLVQPNAGLGHTSAEQAQGELADLQARTRELEAQGAELVVWPEASYPYWIPRDQPAEDPRKTPIRTPVQRGGPRGAPAFSGPLFFGSVTCDPCEERPGLWNSALLLAEDGTFARRFDKINLLMFGEYIPLAETFPFIKKLMPDATGQMNRGKDVVVFPFRSKAGQDIRLGPMICYEDILPAFGRALAAHKPHLLINITNDTWFGDSSEPWHHLALSVFRAVELRTTLVRSVLTGVTAVVDPTGRVTHRTYVVDPSVDPGKDPHGTTLLASVPLLEGGHGVYARAGDVFGWLCAAATAFLWLVLPRVRRRSVLSMPKR